MLVLSDQLCEIVTFELKITACEIVTFELKIAACEIVTFELKITACEIVTFELKITACEIVTFKLKITASLRSRSKKTHIVKAISIITRCNVEFLAASILNILRLVFQKMRRMLK